MSYAVVRCQKMTRGDVKGIEIHDRREKDHSLTNPDIDFSRSGENYDLCPAQNTSFSSAVQERIDQLDLKKAVRKDAVVMAQVIVTSDGAFFDGLKPCENEEEDKRYNAWAEDMASKSHRAYASGEPFTSSFIGGTEYRPLEPDRDRTKEFFRDAYEFLADRYGRENVISATVHMDEQTPHMHFNFVPVTPDGRLSAKDVLNRKSLTEQQDAFHEAVGRKYGLDRGEPKGSGKRRRHMETAEYKAYAADLAEARQRAEAARKDAQTLESRVHALQGDVAVLEGRKDRLTAEATQARQNATEARQSVIEAKRDMQTLEAHQNALRNAVKGLEDRKGELTAEVESLTATRQAVRDNPGLSLAEARQKIETDRKVSRLEQLERFLDKVMPQWRSLFAGFQQRERAHGRDKGMDRG